MKDLLSDQDILQFNEIESLLDMDIYRLINESGPIETIHYRGT